MNYAINSPFHLAFPVTDLELTRAFYVDLLGCKTGRESDQWIDFDFWGHQVVAHLVKPEDHPVAACNAVDGQSVPSMHFGPILPWEEFESLQQRFEQQGISFVVEPYIRFAERKGEQATMFIADPSGNHLEFKSFRNPEMLFAKDESLYQ